MIRAAILLVFALVHFGQPADTWYLAQMLDSNEIVAFTMDGTVRPASISGDWQYGLRVDPSTVLLGIAPQGEATSLYRVTPDGAAKIATPGDEVFRQPLAFANPYVVLRQNTSLLPAPAVLVNAATAQAEPLTGSLPAIARMSADGTLLRYMSADGDQWSLIERTLATGAERIVADFTADNPLPTISADAHGDRWIYETRDENRVRIDNLLTIDGALTTLDAGTREHPLLWSFVGDALVGETLGCGDSCVVRMVTADAKFSLPLPADDNYFALAQPQPGTLLATDSSQNVWLLAAGADPLMLGQYDPLRIFMPPSQLVSPDARYVLTATGDAQYAVWDLTTRMPAATVSAKYVGLILYNAQGFLIHSYGDSTDHGLAYHYADGETVALPHTDVGLYFDLLPDGTLVYMLQKPTDEIGAPGIYRYDPASETYTSVLPNARLTYPQVLG